MKTPTYTEVIDLLKKGLTLEAQEKIMQWREACLQLQEENLQLRQKNSQLEAELSQKKKLKHSRSLYFSEGEVVPYCPRCLETESKHIHLFPGPVDQNLESWECHACSYEYAALNGEDFVAGTQEPRGYSVRTV